MTTEYRAAAMRALDAQVDLIHWIRHSPYTERFHAVWEDSGTGTLHLIDIQDRMLDIAETYALDPEIYELIDAGAHSLPETAALHPTEVISPSGFVYLDRAVVIPDLQGRPTALRAIAWTLTCLDRKIEGSEDLVRYYIAPDGRTPGGREPTNLLCFLYTSPKDTPEDSLHEEILHSDEPDKLADLVLLNFGLFDFNRPLVVDMERWLYTFFRFVQEPWMDTGAFTPNRQGIRRAQRAMVTKRPEVNVVRLRKSEHRHVRGTGDPVEWSHRWLVRGHWRNQWYAKEQRHAPKWVSAYVKGPDEAPLILRDKVSRVDR